MILVSAGVAGQEKVPAKVAERLKPLKIAATSLDKGVLRVVMQVPVVNKGMFRNIALLAVCEPIWSNPKTGWGNARIERVEVVNEIQAQGFAFVDARSFCGALAKITGHETDAFYHRWTLVCVAGNPCRPRRPGEVIAGD